MAEAAFLYSTREPHSPSPENMIRAALLLASAPLAHACTTLIVGKGASADGSVMCTHSNDGEGFQDPRLVHIPAADHPQGAMRPIFFAPESYPRYVGTARGGIHAQPRTARFVRTLHAIYML